ncbi:MAG: divalent-cation tolerance protein CutA [Candidatus Heimdallarchaeota archaeon]|nr:divalent-cation tolerance protein CutA [Candidatus Heimdallarchaeota archaeon]
MFVAIYSTFESMKEAKSLARYLVEEKLLACANLISNVVSIYSWEGKVEESTEIVLWGKTQDHLIDRIKKIIEERHSYSLPALSVYPITTGSEAYLKWIKSETLIKT